MRDRTRFAALLAALFAAACPVFAAPVPAGWRVPGASDRSGGWSEAGTPFHIRGDFNGDGVSDEAWILFRKRGSDWALFAFLGAATGTGRVVKLASEPAAPAQAFVLETIRPSRIVFRTACGKGAVACAEGEPLTIRFRLPSISLCLREGPCSVFVWRPGARGFQRIRMSD